MPVIRECIISEIAERTKEVVLKKDKIIVWYSGRVVTEIMDDYLKLLGRKIDYAIIDNDKTLDIVWDYAWNIPLANKFISVNIKNSKLLSKYHAVSENPKPVHCDIAEKLGNDAIYFLCSDRSEAMRKKLNAMGVFDDNICVLPSENECVEESQKRLESKVENRNRLDLKEIHSIEFGILQEFARFCEQNNLRYWLAGGTMLGAIRHKGFIPWDDDIDVYMPDEDYARFIEIYADNDDYELLHMDRDAGYPFYFAKLAKKRTTLLHLGFPMSYVMGIYIDIFPLVGFPGDKNEQRLQWENEHIAMAEWYWYQDMADLVGEKKMPVTKKEILDGLNMYAYDDADFIGTVSVILQKEWLSKKETFDRYLDAEFEGDKFRVPVGYDEHLTARYGNYMELPPQEKRAFHGFPAYGEV